MSKLLFNVHPLVIDPELAELIGLNEAIVLQQVHYWIEINRKADKNLRDGRYWTYNTINDWHKNNFPFWGVNTIRRTFTSLENMGYLVSGNYNRQSFDRTKWYSINYETLETLKPPICPNWANASAQFGQMHPPNLGEPIPETNAETTGTKSQSQSQTGGEHQFQTQTSDELSEKKPDMTLTPDDDMSYSEGEANREANKESKIKAPIFAPVCSDTDKTEAPKKYSTSDYNTYAELIKVNVDYTSFSNPDDRKLADNLVETMLDVILTESPNTVKIGKEIKSRDIVRSVYLKLNHGHIEYVINQYRAQSRKIIFKGAYMRTMLYNTYTELEAAAANKEAVAANPEQERQPQQPPVKESPQKKNRFINFNQRNIDFDELERLELEQLRAAMEGKEMS